eukprot:g11463.t1
MGLQPLSESAVQKAAEKGGYIDKGDLLLLSIQSKAQQILESCSHSDKSTSGSSPRHEDEELAWNPLGLEPWSLVQEQRDEGEKPELLWNPLGLKGVSKEAKAEPAFLSKPPGLEEVEGHEASFLWSRSTTAGTESSDEALVSDINMVLQMLQTGKCGPPSDLGKQRRSLGSTSSLPPLRGSPFWPQPTGANRGAKG